MEGEQVDLNDPCWWEPDSPECKAALEPVAIVPSKTFSDNQVLMA